MAQDTLEPLQPVAQDTLGPLHPRVQEADFGSLRLEAQIGEGGFATVRASTP